MGVRVFWIDTGWNSIFNRMNGGKYDCVMSAINDTTAREQNFAMTDPYFISSIVIVSRKETNEQQADAGGRPAKETIDRAEKLNGRKVGMLKDIKRRDTMTDLQTQYPKIKIKGFSDSAKLFKALPRSELFLSEPDFPPLSEPDFPPEFFHSGALHGLNQFDHLLEGQNILGLSPLKKRQTKVPVSCFAGR